MRVTSFREWCWYLDDGNPQKIGHCRWRCVRKDLSFDCLFKGYFSRGNYLSRRYNISNSYLGLRPHRLWKLRRRRRGRWKTRRTSPLGYSGSRRLRSSTTSVLSRFPRHPHLLCCRLARFTRQRPGKVDIRSHAFLLWPTSHSRRMQKRPPIRPQDYWRATKNFPKTSHSRGRNVGRAKDWRAKVSWM